MDKEEKKDPVMVKVVATAQGYDGLCVREPGQEFMIDERVFDPKPKLNEKLKPIPNEFHEPPSWFKRVEEHRGERKLFGKKDDKDLA